MDAVAICRGQFDGLQISQHFKIACGDPFSVVPHLFRTGKLMDAKTRSDIRQVIFEACSHDLVVPGSRSGIPAPGVV